MTTARDVTTGTCNPNQNNPATVGPDLATGHGLVDAHRASLLARLRCRVDPADHHRAADPADRSRSSRSARSSPSADPTDPTHPADPAHRPDPAHPADPADLAGAPITPINPIRPIGPVIQPTPIPIPGQGMTGTQRAAPDLTEEELDDLEDMVRKGQIDPDAI